MNHKLTSILSAFTQSVVLLVVILSLHSCSTEKNTVTSRAYHNITAHYNVYFNGKESLKRGELQIDESVEDDYTRLLPVYKSSRELTGSVGSSDMDYAIEKGLKLIKLHSIKKKPKQKNNASKRYKEFRERGEYNNWVDDAHLLIGKANFYKRQYFLAEVEFQHIARYYKNTPTAYMSRIWLARTYIEQDRLMEARETLQKLEAEREFPRQLFPDLNLAWTNVLMQANQYDEAIERLKVALEGRFSRKDKLRYYYILGQLYQETNQTMLASETFNKLVRMRPHYRMAFYARIQRAEMGVTEENFASLQKQLKRMLRDSKNKEFEDRIYYAFGNMYWAQGKRSEAITDFIISAARATEHPDQRAQSCLRLARIYFDQKDYVPSQAYYDSAMVVLDESYPNFDLISKRSKVLTELVNNLQVIEVQDSLQRMAALNPSERDKVIRTHIQNLQEQERIEQERQRQLEQERNYYKMNNNRLSLPNSNTNNWYFYNPTTVSAGKMEFERIYGKRKLVDNWRRTDLSIIDFGDEMYADDEEIEGGEDGESKNDSIPVRVDDKMQVAFYTQDLPTTDSLVQVSDAMIQEAYYNAARIMRLDLQDTEQAIELYDELIRRYPKGTFELIALFDRYDIALMANDGEGADKHKMLILTGYPDSKYAAYIKNPNFFAEQQALQDSTMRIYSRSLDAYYKRNFALAAQEASRLRTLTSDSAMLAKAEFVETVSLGTSMALVDFEAKLFEYLEKYPKGETSILAEEILMLVRDRTLSDFDQMLADGYVNENIINQELKTGSDIDDGFGGKWDYTEEVFHYYILFFPKSYNIDVNRLVFDIAHFNIDYYPEDDFDIELANLNNQYQMVVVRSMENKEEALIYFNSIIRRREVFEQFEGREYVNLVSSSNNYRTILGDQDFREYNRFFMKNISRFSGHIAPTSELEDPMELLKKARQKREEVQGDFVVIDTDIAPAMDEPVQAPKALYTYDSQAPHDFVLLVSKVGTNVNELKKRIEAFNKSNFGSPDIGVSIGRFNANQLIVTVTGLGIQESAMSYSRKFVRDRSLYEPISSGKYRNFVISTRNRSTLKKQKDSSKYMDFYKKEYLKK